MTSADNTGDQGFIVPSSHNIGVSLAWSSKAEPMARLLEMQDMFIYDDCKGDQVRLVRISRNVEEGLSLQISTFAVDKAPDYTALSYRWGNGHRTIPVEANAKTLNITPSLKDFLVEVCARQTDGAQACPILSGWFWIDVICINQDDLEDRSRQVRRMKEIYENARHVIVWLGVADDGTEDAFDLLEQIAALPSIEDHDVSLRPGSMPEDTCKLLVDEEYVECLYSCLTFDVSAVLQADYLSRAWIIQEATTPGLALADDARQLVWCGSHTMGWETLVEANYKLVEASWNNRVADKAQLHGIASQALCTLAYLQRRRRASPLPTENLYTMLVRSRRAGATDARDKLYAVLGLAENSALKAIQPDYSLSTATVYTNLARTIIETTDSLDCLGSASLIRDHDVPSWVPCWTVQHTVVPQPFYQHFRSYNRHDESVNTEGPLFAAANGIKPIVSFSEDNCVLAARGFCFDTIVDSSQSRQWLSRHDATAELWQNWIDVAGFSSGDCYATGGSRFDAFSKVLKADFKDVCGDWSASRGSETPAFVDTSVNAFELRDALIDAMTDNRVLIRTFTGYLGLAPATAELGDRVCILFGSQMPVVMRSNGDFWTFVGQTYVHGIMDGEAVTEGNLLEGIRDFEIISKPRNGRPGSLDCTHLETEGSSSPRIT